MYFHDRVNEKWRILAWDLDRTFLPVKATRDLLAPIIPVLLFFKKQQLKRMMIFVNIRNIYHCWFS